MFEDSLMESSGSIKTKSKWWSVAAFLANGSILLIMILVPLVYPEALPKQALTRLLVAPPPPAPAAAQVRAQPTRPNTTTILPSVPTAIPTTQTTPTVIRYVTEDAPPPSLGGDVIGNVADSSPGGPLSGIRGSIGSTPAPVVTAAVTPKETAVVSSGVAAGNLLNKIVPIYPAIAKAARISGTVVVLATISKSGVIENAKAISGPQMLRQAAVDGVRTARYKPYLLNGEPVAVETTVNVIFSLGS